MKNERKTMPFPIRFTKKMLQRLEIAADRLGLASKTGVVRLGLILFLDALERTNYRLPGIDDWTKKDDKPEDGLYTSSPSEKP